jgi:hypothetical protein
VIFRRSRRGRSGISAQRVAVRPHRPWYWQAAAIVALLSISLAVAAWMYDASRRYAVFGATASAEEVRAMKERVAELEKENVALRDNPESTESRLKIERAAQQVLAAQVKSLEEENARLKEELALLEKLAATEDKDGALRIDRLRVEPDGASGVFRYRMLVTLQGDRKEREFKGAMQLVVHLQQDGKSAMMVLPSSSEGDRQRFTLAFRHFKRVEGTFKVPEGAQVKSVEVRLLQDGATKASQTVML